jgi:hypothetical protein
VQRAFGDYLGFVTGWCDFANQAASMAFMGVACSEFLAQLVPEVAGHEGLVAPVLIMGLAAAVSTACRSSGVSTASTAALNACPRSLPSRVSSGPRSLSSSAFLVLQARVTHPDGRGEPSFNLLPWWLLW